MKSVLIVGGSGFVGCHTITRLLKGGYRIWSTCSPSKKPPAFASVHWLPCDLTQPHAMHGWPDRCDHVVFLAQSRGWRRFPEAADDTFLVNLGGLHQTLLYACRAGISSLVFASSGSVYSRQDHAARESDVIDLAAPRSYYVASKLASELLLGAFRQLFTVVQLRLFMPYGQGQHEEMLFPQLIQRVRRGQPISLHGSDGLVANPLAAPDVAEAIERCLHLQQSLTMNVAGPEILTLRQISAIIGKVLQQPPIFEMQARVAPPVIAGDVTLLRDTLAWAPATRLETGLSEWLHPASENNAA